MKLGKRGTKPKPGNREPSGRLSRRKGEKSQREVANVDADMWDAMSVALLGRTRVHKVPLNLARDQKAASWIGRLTLEGTLTQIQYDAAQTYLNERMDYYFAIGAPREPGAVDLNRVQGLASGRESVSRYHQAKDRWNTTTKALQAVQNDLRGTASLFAALDLCVSRDVALHHMTGDLRLALNALVKHYKLASRIAA